ncbi:MAG: LacI family transcriptional regulator [Verrucomicrobia bacterium]|jgi:LacI family transcriptional regulator|nr:LacI family transcriptional regulator [Verrucomicrobiota bacterium]
MTVRLKDIALRANVSVMTVSKALRDAPDVSEATKARIRALAQQMGYVPDSAARGLRTRTTRTFGVVISSTTNPIFARVLMAIEQRAQEMGYDLILTHTHNLPEREEHCIYRLLARRVDGIFVSPVYRMSTEARAYQELQQRGTPVVILGHTAPFCAHFVNVETDDVQASYELTRHLLGQGHKRIAFLSGPLVSPWTQERLEGYRRALREHHIEPDDHLVFQAGRTVEDGIQAVSQMIAEKCDATAVQAVNDLVAVGCMRWLIQHGVRIPDDVSVTGFGNLLISENAPRPLTTARQPKFTLGMAAMDAMVALLNHQHPPSRRLPAELLVRQSTGTAPAQCVLSELGSSSPTDD